jgi:hypothetical protein
MRKTTWLALLLLCGTAQASVWVSIGKTSDGTAEGFVEVSSIKIAGDIRLAWFKYAYINHKAYTMERDEFDCGRDTTRGQTYTIYSEDGTQMEAPGPLPSEWKPVVPDTMGSMLMQFVCAWKPK